jgi:hypothetical protein
MQSLVIVESQITPQPLPRNAGSVIFVKIDLFIFDTAPEPFGKDVIQRVAFAIHADPHILSEQTFDILWTGEVAALIAVPDFGSSDLQRTVNCCQNEGHFQRLVEFPTYHITRVPVEDGYQVHPATRQADIDRTFALHGRFEIEKTSETAL